MRFRTVLKRSIFEHWRDGKPTKSFGFSKHLEMEIHTLQCVSQHLCVWMLCIVIYAEVDVETPYNVFKALVMLFIFIFWKWFVAWKIWKWLEMEIYLVLYVMYYVCVWMLCKWFVSKKMWVGYQLSDSDPTSVTDMAPKVHIDNTHSCRHARTHTRTHTNVRQYDCKRYLKHVIRDQNQ